MFGQFPIVFYRNPRDEDIPDKVFINVVKAAVISPIEFIIEAQKMQPPLKGKG